MNSANQQNCTPQNAIHTGDLREIYRFAGLSDVKSDVKCDAEFFGR
jgi:hypothetical protein